MAVKRRAGEKGGSMDRLRRFFDKIHASQRLTRALLLRVHTHTVGGKAILAYEAGVKRKEKRNDNNETTKKL